MRGDNGQGTSVWRRFAPLVISGSYLVLASLYIFTSDELLSQVTSNSIVLTRVQIFKGLAFVLVTALLLFWLLSRIRRRFRRVEARSEHSEARFRQMIETSNEGVWIIDEEARTIFANESLAALLGYAADDLVGRPHEAFVDPASRDVARAHLERCKVGERHVYECRLRHRDGSERWVLMSCSPLRDIDDRFLSSLVMVTDITERKLAEDALADACRAQQNLLNELNHRVRNNLSTLLGLIEIGRSRAANVGEFATSIGGRVGAMNRAYSMLAGSNWQPPRFDALVETVAEGDVRQSLRFDGPEVRVPPQQVGALALVIYELLSDTVARAPKSNGMPEIRITWTAEPADDGGTRIELDWVDRVESTRPSSSSPAAEQRQTGLELVKGLVRSDLRGDAHLEVTERGARHHLLFSFDPMPRISPSRVAAAV